VFNGPAAGGAVCQELLLDRALLCILEPRPQDHGVVRVTQRAEEGGRGVAVAVGEGEL
jgi:hypothetical protein